MPKHYNQKHHCNSDHLELRHHLPLPCPNKRMKKSKWLKKVSDQATRRNTRCYLLLRLGGRVCSSFGHSHLIMKMPGRNPIQKYSPTTKTKRSIWWYRLNERETDQTRGVGLCLSKLRSDEGNETLCSGRDVVRKSNRRRSVAENGVVPV